MVVVWRGLVILSTGGGDPRGGRGVGAGFTLVEILVVMAIISILAGITYVVYPIATERGRIAQCASNLRQIGVALIAYAEDNDGFAPPYRTNEESWGSDPWESSEGLVKAMEPYLGDNSLWFCPSDPYAGKDDCTWDVWHKWTSYTAYFGNATPPWPYPLPEGWKPNPPGTDSDLPPGTLYDVVSDANRHYFQGGQHRGRFNMLYWDGHVETYRVKKGTPDVG